METKDKNYNENQMYVAHDTRLALERYAVAERTRNAGSAIVELITWKSLAQHILRNEVQKRGYYKEAKK